MQAGKPRQASASRRRIAAAKLSELGGRGARGPGRHHPRAAHRQGPHPLLPRHRQRGAQSAGRGRAAADWHRLGRRDRRDRRARACSTHGTEVPAWTLGRRPLPERPWVFRRGPIERAAALADAPAAFIRHNTFIEPQNVDERGAERHVWADHESAAPRSRPVPDRTLRMAAGPGHRADTMSSHDTDALDADQEERSADGVTGGRDEPAELVLGRLEARMAESGLRAHIYLTERTVVEFATRRKRTDRAAGTQRRAGRSGAFSRSCCVPSRNRKAGSGGCTPSRRDGVECRRRRCAAAPPSW